MKRTFLTFGVLMSLATTISSCKKNYDCTCTVALLGDIVHSLNGYKEADAQETCDEHLANAQATDPTATCVLTVDE